MNNWYVINTKPRREDSVKMMLEKAGLECYVPKLKVRKFFRGRYSDRVESLFPNYLFARFDPSEHLWMISYTRGVKNVVSSGGKALSVPCEALAYIRSHEEDGFVFHPTGTVEVGDRVEVLNGPFAGLQGIFVRPLAGEERVVVLLDALQYQAQAVVDKAMLIKV